MADATRRDFLKTTSTLAAGAGLLQAIAPGAHAQGDDTLLIGVVGCGGRGSGATAQALSSPGKVRLISMGDAFRDAIDGSLNSVEREVKGKEGAEVQVAEENKFVGFDAYKKVIDSGVDVVILATPPGFRPQMLEYAVEKGVHVFMEKPVAIDAPGVRRVLEAAKKAKEKGLKIGVGLQRRHQGVYKDFVGRIHNGDLGKVHAMRVYWNGGGVWEPRASREQVKTEVEYQVRNWYYYNWLSGDHICEQHIHNLDVGNWVMQGALPQSVEKNDDGSWKIKGWPVRAQGMGGREVRKENRYGDIYDHHAIEFFYEDGTVMFSQCRHIKNCWNSVSEHIHCTNGIVDLAGGARGSKLNLYNGEAVSYKGETDDPYQVEHNDLFGAIRTGTDYSEAVSGAMSTMTSILGRMCSYSGKEISMEEALNKGATIIPDDIAFDGKAPVYPDENGHYSVPVPGVTNVFA